LHDHNARDGYERECKGDTSWAGVDLVDHAGPDVVDEARLAQGKVVDADVEERATPCWPLRSLCDPVCLWMERRTLLAERPR